jgi:hypothetical protein
MAHNQNCCPLCNQTFIPADGITADEHLANGIIAAYAEMQRKASQENCASNLPCPRCGHYHMSCKSARNALSRRARIHICDGCGTREAMEAFAGDVPPITTWWVVTEMLPYRDTSDQDIPY